MFDHILVVCIGNICRSPVAEGLLKKALADRGAVVESAGLGALVDRPAEPHSVEIAKSLGVDISAHRARQLTTAMLETADLVLVMENRHVEAITRMAPQARGKTKLVGHWCDNAEVPDPYRQPVESYEHSIELIEQSVKRWLVHL